MSWELAGATNLYLRRNLIFSKVSNLLLHSYILKTFLVFRNTFFLFFPKIQNRVKVSFAIFLQFANFSCEYYHNEHIWHCYSLFLKGYFFTFFKTGVKDSAPLPSPPLLPALIYEYFILDCYFHFICNRCWILETVWILPS